MADIDVVAVLRRQKNFTLKLEGATTKEAIEAQRVAAFQAAESARLQVPLSLSVVYCPGRCGIPTELLSLQTE